MPSSSEGADGDGTPSLPLFRGCALLPWVVRTAMERRPYRRKRQECRFPEWSRRSAALPWFRAGGGLLFAARSRHEEPYPPMSKINLAFPFTVPFKGNAGKYIQFPQPTQAGILKIEVLRGGESEGGGDLRPET